MGRARETAFTSNTDEYVQPPAIRRGCGGHKRLDRRVIAHVTLGKARSLPRADCSGGGRQCGTTIEHVCSNHPCAFKQ